ncbi:MAG TPA: hypothetical protein VFZ93_04320 [Albitalea sp.]
MSLRERIGGFVARHGLTWRSDVLSILLFPPAAVYIACRKPGLTLPGRIAANVVAVAAPPAIGAATLAALAAAVDFVRAAL